MTEKPVDMSTRLSAKTALWEAVSSSLNRVEQVTGPTKRPLVVVSPSVFQILGTHNTGIILVVDLQLRGLVVYTRLHLPYV